MSIASLAPPPSPVSLKVTNAYAELVCSITDQNTIRELVLTIANSSYIELGWNAFHLQKLGKEIAHVHPLKFLATILKDPDLKNALVPIFADPFKRINFMGGIFGGLGTFFDREMSKDNVTCHLEYFAEDINLSPQGFKEKLPFFQEKNWEELVRSFL